MPLMHYRASSPFPGMDPYVERFWNDVQASLVVYASDALNGTLSEHYRATLGTRHIRSNVDRGEADDAFTFMLTRP